MFVTAVLILIFDKKIHDELAYVWLTSFASANANIGISSVIRVYGDAISNPLLLVLFIKIIYNLAIFCLRGVLNRIQIIDKSAISPPLFPSQLGEVMSFRLHAIPTEYLTPCHKDLAVSAVYLSANLDGEFALTLIFTLTLTLIRDSGLLHEIHSRLVAHRGNITRSAAFMAKQYFVMQQDLVAGFLSAPTIFIIVLVEYVIPIGTPKLTAGLTQSKRKETLFVYVFIFLSSFPVAYLSWAIFKRRLQVYIEHVENVQRKLRSTREHRAKAHKKSDSPDDVALVAIDSERVETKVDAAIQGAASFRWGNEELEEVF